MSVASALSQLHPGRIRPGLGSAGLLAAVLSAVLLGIEGLPTDQEGSVFPLMLFLGGSALASVGLIRRLLRVLS